MTRTLPSLGLILLGLLGCPKAASRAPSSETVLADWTRAQLDLRAWRSCARSALALDLAQAEILFEVDAEGGVGGVSLEPVAQEHDPGMICLAMELAHPPTNVPSSGTAHTVRFRAGAVHELPGGTN